MNPICDCGHEEDRHFVTGECNIEDCTCIAFKEETEEETDFSYPRYPIPGEEEEENEDITLGEAFTNLYQAAKEALDFLHSKARRDPAERDIVRQLEDAVAKAEGRQIGEGND